MKDNEERLKHIVKSLKTWREWCYLEQLRSKLSAFAYSRKSAEWRNGCADGLKNVEEKEILALVKRAKRRVVI